MRRTHPTILALAAATLLAACVDTIGNAEFATSEIRLRASGVAALSRVSSDILLSESGLTAAIAPSDVASLTVTVTRIDYLPASAEDDDQNGNDGNGEDGDSSWQSLTLNADTTLDLMQLPSEGESPIVIASGSVPVGDYRKVRLFISSAEIIFANTIDVGAAVTFDADTPYPVDVPSAAQTGIKTDVSFSVTESGGGETNAVDLLFDSGTTFSNVTATGNARVKMAPVLRSPN